MKHRIITGGTDNHLQLVNLRARDEKFTGTAAAAVLEKAGTRL